MRRAGRFRWAPLMLAAWCASGAGAAETAPPLAWVRFEKAPESYAGRPYYWLGRCELTVSLDVPPAAGQALQLLWGSKKDTRGAEATVNGRRVALRGGGYDGFRWLDVPLPKGLSGGKYEVVLRAVGPKAAFLAAVRLLGPGGGADRPDPQRPAAFRAAVRVRAIAGASAPVAAGHPFPEMRPLWETPAPPPERPCADPAEEAAFRRAERCARQAGEMYFRCRRLVDGWLACADPNTGLLPRRVSGSGRTYWNAKDCAADLYPFLTLTCALTDREMFDGPMRKILETETRLTCRIDRLPDTYSFVKGGFLAERADLGAILFGASEYVKDGLMPLTEWLGESPWRERMLGIVDDMWKHAPVPTPFGKIVSTNFEVNGEMLQVLSRLYWMTGREKYLQWARRLGDYYLLGDHHPTRDMRRLSMDDHGCEAVSGLCELYAAVHYADRARKAAYRKPLYRMLDDILAGARTEHGLFWDWFEPKTGRHAGSLTDNWGYDLNGFYTVYMVDGTEAYRQAVLKALSNLSAHYMDYRWERGGADGYADSVEGAINLLNREPVASAGKWVDNGIRQMWRRQRPDGIVEGWYGDGNSARTAIMYALMKSQGITVRPWRADVFLGAVRRGEKVCISLRAARPWKGRILFDRPRHALQMRLPIDYPRINQFPEWFTVRADRKYELRDLAGEAAVHSGSELAAGIPVALPAGRELRLVVRPADPAGGQRGR